jgi:hypothetical protein
MMVMADLQTSATIEMARAGFVKPNSENDG